MNYITSVFACILMSFGCTTLRLNEAQDQPYQAQVVVVDDSVRNVLRSLQRNAEEQGWTVTRLDEQTGVLEAYTPPVDEEGFRSREHWTFVVTGNLVSGSALSVRRMYEVQFAPDEEWQGSTLICGEYMYAREQQQLSRIVSRLGNT